MELISKKTNFARAAHFFVQFARLQRETSFNFLVTRFMDETCVPVHWSSLCFFTAAHLYPGSL